MGKRIRDYVKYTLSELECYVATPTSCVSKINTAFHLNFPPYGLANFRKTLRNIIAEKKIGVYDAELKGIILDMRNIKVLGDVAALRSDDPAIHLNLRADCYVFQPSVGAIIQGLVKHVSDKQIGVIIYRVFCVSIRFDGVVPRQVQLNSEIQFRIKQFELDGFMPFIEGELVTDVEAGNEQKESKFTPNGFTPKRAKNSIKFEPKIETGSSGYHSDGSLSKRVKKEVKSSSDSEDDDIDPAQRKRPYRGSPDLFANLSGSEDETTQKSIKADKSSQKSPFKPIKVKEEQLSQLFTEKDSLDLHNSSRKGRRQRKTSATFSENSDLEPGQRIKSELNQSLAHDAAILEVKEEILSQSQRKKSKHKKHSNSLAEVDEVEVEKKIKAEKVTQSQIAEQSSSEMQSEEAPRHKKSKSKNKPTELEEDEITLKLESSAIGRKESADETKRHKRKRSESLDEIQPTPALHQTAKKRKNSLNADKSVTTLVNLDSDFEVAASTPLPAKPKKKKKAHEETFNSLDTTNVSSQLEATIEVVDLDDYTPRREKKKKKKSRMDMDEL